MEKKVVGMMVCLLFIGTDVVLAIGDITGEQGKVQCISETERSTILGDGTWAFKSPMPTQRLDGVSAVVNGNIFIIGGWVQPAGQITDKVEEGYHE